MKKFLNVIASLYQSNHLGLKDKGITCNLNHVT